MASGDVLFFLIQLSTLLIASRVFGEVCKLLKQPAIVGEIIGGILIGPSLFGHFFPETFNHLFVAHTSASVGMDGIYTVALIMLLFISGMEVELPLIWTNGRSALFISLVGMIIPMGIGLTAGWYLYDFFGMSNPDYKITFSLFMGTAFSITALPVIAKILMDLNLLNTKVGGLIITSAMLDDFAGWILFSVTLSMMPTSVHSIGQPTIGMTILLTTLFAIVVLTVFKFIFSKLFSYISKKISSPGSMVTIAMGMCFIGAVVTEYLGVHAVFGAFLMGMAFGESMQFTQKTKEIIHEFVANIFAPLFFVSIGLKVNFVENFDLAILMVVLVIAFVSKISGGFIGSKLGGLSNYESLAIGFGINARGAMEIILGLLALQAHIINEKIFVALTIMALLTSLSSGNFIRFFLNKDFKLKLPKNATATDEFNVYK